jgi:pimeloyl-ACP methyl ester carboxylesterase
MRAADFLSLPDAEEVVWVTAADGARLPIYALAGPGNGKALLFGHANGFAAGSYAPLLRDLARHVDVFAYDARGHGGSVLPEGPAAVVAQHDHFAVDLDRVAAAVTARPGVSDLAYIGHSLGAASALELELRGGFPGASAMMLFEPPIFPVAGSPAYVAAAKEEEPLAAAALRRRADWASPEAFCARLQGRGAFARFTPAMLSAHCRATLKPKTAGGYTLCCPPEIEAEIYRGHRAADTWRQLDRVTRKIDLIGGDPNLPGQGWVAGVMGDLARLLPAGRLTVLSGASHLMFFEQPDRCRELILSRM